MNACFLNCLRWTTMVLLLGVALAVEAEPIFLPETTPQKIFAGGNRPVLVRMRNPVRQIADAELRVVIFQASSDTTARISNAAGGELQMFPGHTVLETAVVSFPNVNAETRFLVQWCKGTNQVFGTTKVLVSPKNLLAAPPLGVRGRVLLVGAKLAWRSGDTCARAGEYHFAARSLETPS